MNEEGTYNTSLRYVIVYLRYPTPDHHQVNGIRYHETDCIQHGDGTVFSVFRRFVPTERPCFDLLMNTHPDIGFRRLAHRPGRMWVAVYGAVRRIMARTDRVRAQSTL